MVGGVSAMVRGAKGCTHEVPLISQTSDSDMLGRREGTG
jgi:hypothetical protein